VTRRSLRLRLLLASVLSIVVALILAGIVLVGLFERHATSRFEQEMLDHIRQLAAHVEFDREGVLSLSNDPPDPLFHRPLSGLYWQIEEPQADARLRSRSLWDIVLPLPKDKLAVGVTHHHQLAGPGGSSVLALEQLFAHGPADEERVVRIAVAIDALTLNQAVAAFASDLTPALIILGLFLCLAAAVQIWFGLRPFEAVRRGIGAVRERSRDRLVGPFPDEVMPLVNEVNQLLDAQDQAIEKARHRAADLAHGLKTPLTVIASDAKKLRSSEQPELADELDLMVRRMRGHIDHQLARARVAADTSRRTVETDLVAVVTSVVETICRTPRGESLELVCRLPCEAAVAVESHDLTEIVGNILENASKWAERRVQVEIQDLSTTVTLVVSDDGPGVDDQQIGSLGQRGLRLDEETPGTGMGLAIVREIAACYGGDVSFENMCGGGFRVTVRLSRSVSVSR